MDNRPLQRRKKSEFRILSTTSISSILSFYIIRFIYPEIKSQKKKNDRKIRWSITVLFIFRWFVVAKAWSASKHTHTHDPTAHIRPLHHVHVPFVIRKQTLDHIFVSTKLASVLCRTKKKNGFIFLLRLRSHRRWQLRRQRRQHWLYWSTLYRPHC